MSIQDQIRRFIRLESPEEELFENLANIQGIITCILTPDDWMTLYEKMEDMEQEVATFLPEFVRQYLYLMDWKRVLLIDDDLSELEVLQEGAYFGRMMDSFIRHIADWGIDIPVGLLVRQDRALEEAFASIQNNEGLPFEKRKFPVGVKEDFIRNVHRNIRYASPETIALYKEYVEALCAENNLTALEAKAYDCYEGNAAYEGDWNTCKHYLLKLLEISGNDSKKVQYANTLGLIYYDGRCNDGLPEYDKALELFSIGAAAGCTESVYKLSDMMRRGEGMRQNKVAGENLLWWIFEKEFDRFVEEQDTKIADLAIRLGNIEAESGEPEAALYYYTMADYDIRMRLPKESYENNPEFKAVQAAIVEGRDQAFYESGHTNILANRPIAIENIFEEDHIAKITLEEVDEESLKITAVRQQKASEEKTHKVELAFGQFGYYNLVNSVEEHVLGEIMYESKNNEMTFYADNVVWEPIAKALKFTLFGEVVAVIVAQQFSFDLPSIRWPEARTMS